MSYYNITVQLIGSLVININKKEFEAKHCNLSNVFTTLPRLLSLVYSCAWFPYTRHCDEYIKVIDVTEYVHRSTLCMTHSNTVYIVHGDFRTPVTIKWEPGFILTQLLRRFDDIFPTTS